MKQAIFQDPSWFNATTLNERLTLHNLYGLNLQETDNTNVDIAHHHLRAWKKQPPFTTEANFRRRLKLDGMNEEDFLHLLGESLETVQGRFSNPPKWLTNLMQAFTVFPLENTEIVQRIQNVNSDEKLQQFAGFLNLVVPLMNWGSERLRKGLQSISQVSSTQNIAFELVEDIFITDLAAQFLPMISRTLILELNVARLRGVLQGETPFERFQNFTHHLSQEDFAFAILQEYPVLARQLSLYVDDCVNFCIEFIQHLSEDWEVIQETFSPQKELGTLVGLQIGAGDKHQGGRSVIIVYFESGLQLVYKPRSLSVDIHFQKLLIWLNDQIGQAFFRTIKVLERDTYGWVEFVEAKGCESVEEIQRFYTRQGAYLSLLWIIGATDFHFENVIASGEYPVLIDLETLLHPRMNNLLQIDTSLSDNLVAQYMANSVIHVGLLPMQLWIGEDFEGVDISGLGADQDQLFTPTKIVRFDAIGTDEMRVVRERVQFSGANNRPHLNGEDVNPLDYIQSMIDGFTQMSRLILTNRDTLLADDGILNQFATSEIRTVIRPTQTYALLLLESFHPDLLRNALDRERHFDRLWVNIDDSSYYEQVISAEREELWNGNIPAFFTHPNSCDLWSSSGQHFNDFFQESSLDFFRRRLQELNEREIERQIWFMRASFTTLDKNITQKSSPAQQLYYTATSPDQCALDPEQCLEAAQKVGDRLETLAIQGQKDACWVGLYPLGKSMLPLPLGTDLYCGLPGISLFLAYLGITTRDNRYTDLAWEALKTAQRQMEENRSDLLQVGAFNGWGGMLYALTHLSQLWREPDLLNEAIHIVDVLPELITQDKELDIMSGTAGCLGSLLSLYRIAPSQDILNVMLQCGDLLITRAQKMDRGVGWTSNMSSKTPLTGFSHGAAGIAWVLLELSALTNEKRFYSTALDAIAYERGIFSLEDVNWSNLQELKIVKHSDKHANVAWCHGAPGIALARLLSLPHINDEKIYTEIDAALQTTCSYGFGRSHCLCHGDMGNLDILLVAGQMLPDLPWESCAHHIAKQVFVDIQKQGWLCGTPLNTETPGLMDGLAGMGYEFLRFANPDLVPSILSLSPPNLTRE